MIPARIPYRSIFAGLAVGTGIACLIAWRAGTLTYMFF